jgi:hypothetical protein
MLKRGRQLVDGQGCVEGSSVEWFLEVLLLVEPPQGGKWTQSNHRFKGRGTGCSA